MQPAAPARAKQLPLLALRAASTDEPADEEHPLHIAHFVQRYPPALGGSEAYFQRLSRYLVGRGHAVTVWTTNAIDLEAFWSKKGRSVPSGESVEDGVIVRRFASLRWPLRRYMLKAASFLPGPTWKAMTMPCNPIAVEMWREAGRFAGPCDAVHASAFPYAWPIVCARRLAEYRGVPFLLTPFLHLGSPDQNDRTRRQYLSKPLRALLQSADRIFVQTPSERRAVSDLGISDEKIILQGMGVEPSECVADNVGDARMRLRGDAKLPAKSLVLGHLANLSFEKGTIDLLQAAAKLWTDGLEFAIVLAGPDMKNFRRFWATYPYRENVRLLGVLNDEQKRDFFSGIDLFALPSRSDSFGLVLLEAWANGIPNIVYRAGGPADLVRHGTDGVSVRCGDVDGFADGLRGLLADAAFRRRLGEAGRARIGTEFRWDEKLAMVEREMIQSV
jgi:glycosyltransferase involved in cell wall biosynthesis